MAVIQVEENWTQKPVDRRIFGNFIESGFGRQVNGMWSEMLYNRAFRDVPAIKIATWEWLGLDKSIITVRRLSGTAAMRKMTGS